MSAGSIIIDLLMRTGSFETDTKRAEKRLRELKKEAEQIGKGIGVAFAAVAAASVALVKSSIDAADATSKLAQSTGTSVENLSALTYAAGLADVSQQDLGTALVKLTKNMSDAANGSGEAAKGFSALGISVKNADGTLKSSDQVLTEIAEKFAGFRDGAEKTALAVNLFGKSGASLIPLLNGGASGLKEMREEAMALGVVIDAELGRASEEFNDNLTRLGQAIRGVGNRAARELLPALTDVSKALTDLAKDEAFVSTTTDVISTAVNGLIVVFQTIAVLASDVAFVFRSVGREMGAWAAQAKALGISVTDGLKGPAGIAAALAQAAIDGKVSFSEFSAISDAVKKDGEKARRELDDFQARVMSIGQPKYRDPRILGDPGSIADQARAIGGSKPPAPRIPGKGEGGDDPTKKLLDNRLKDLERAVRSEQDLLSDRNKFLDLYNGQGVLSIASYYDAQQTILEAATSAQLDAYDKQLAALRQYQSEAKKATDREGAQGKIDDVLAKRFRLEQESGQKSIELNFKQAEAVSRYERQIEAVNAQLLELRGNLGEAAAIRFDQQNLELVQRLTAEGNAGALAMLKNLRDMTIAQAKFTQEATLSGQIIEGLQLTEDRIAISRELGATTELGALKQLGEARSAAVLQMEAMVKAQEAIAKASGNPALVLNAERARLELEKLRATADPLADKFRSIFQDSFADAFAGLIDGTKTAKEALKSFVSDVTSQLTRIASQNVAETLFGKEGPLGGVGELFGGAFGGALGGGKSAARPSVDTSAITSSLSTLQVTGVDPVTIALTRLQQAADAAAGALGGRGKSTGGGESTPADVPWESGFNGESGDQPSSGGVPWESGFEGASGVSAETAATTGSIAEFGKTATDAASSILKLADAAGQGGGAISKLPQLLQSLFSSFGGSGGSGGGGGGDGTWASLAGIAISLFGGAKASGGDVIPGRSYLVGEMGPERFVPRTSGTILSNQQTTRPVEQRPIQVIQNFPAGTNRATADQAAAQAGAAVRRANARTR